jgi:hypothetical protein
MQKDMHFYGIYALARAAGVQPETAKKIAYASQFVDDAIEDEAIVLDGENKQAVLPTMTSHRPIDYQNTIPGDQWKVWVPFHFLPGNDENAQTFAGKMVCLKDSKPAGKMLDHAMKYKKDSFGPHLAGITAHVYADTFAHYGFAGLSRDWNRVQNDSIDIRGSDSIRNYLWNKFETFKTRVAGSLAEAVPVGHGSVGTFPDRPYLHWEYEYESIEKYGSRGKVVRNNLDDFMEASERLHTFFGNFIQDNSTHGDPVSPVIWNSIADRVHDILETEGTLDERIELWKRAISSADLFDPTDEDRIINYSEKLWKSDHLIYHFSKEGTVDNSDACLFFRAAWKHRNYVLHELLPEVEIIAY